VYDNKTLCAKCKGKCCKRSPGLMRPDDLVLIPELLDDIPEMIEDAAFRLLSSGQYILDGSNPEPRPEYDCGLCDWDESDCTTCPHLSQVWILRPRAIDDGDQRMMETAPYRGQCIHLKDNGCGLEPDARPYQCRMLEPIDEHTCESHARDAELAKAWIPYQEQLLRAAKRADSQNTNGERKHKW